MATRKRTKETPPAELAVRAFKTRSAWARWLEAHHASSPGIWLELAKKGSSKKSISRLEAVEVALCFGWIDGQGRRQDETTWLQKFTPRRARSIWSKINRDRALALIESGEMRPPGRLEIERAQKDGRWQAAYDPPSRATVPGDLKQALAKNARARKFFSELDARNRFAILFRIHDAKKPETRARRIADFVAMLARRETLHR